MQAEHSTTPALAGEWERQLSLLKHAAWFGTADTQELLPLALRRVDRSRTRPQDSLRCPRPPPQNADLGKRSQQQAQGTLTKMSIGEGR